MKKKVQRLLLMLVTFVVMTVIGSGTAMASTYASNIKGACEPYYYYRAEMNDYTIAGDTYTDGIGFNTYNSVPGEACLDLGGKYQTFSFVAGSIDGKQDRTLTIEADGTKVYEQVIAYNAIPKGTTISVKGVSQLTLRVSGSSSSFNTVVGNIQLSPTPGSSNAVVESNFLENLTPYQSSRYSAGTMQMGNKTYENCLCFNTYNSVAGEASFNLKGEYKSMSFVVGSQAGNGTDVSKNPRTVTILADGVTIYEQTVAPDEVPKAGSISLAGVYQLTIRVSGSPSSFNTGIGGINLVSDGKVRGITLDKASMSLNDNNPSAYLKASITPDDALNQTVIWSSSDTSVATVSSSGLVNGLKSGTAVITAKTADGGYEAVCSVTVDMTASLSGATVTLSKTSYTYSGNANKPGVTVTCGGKTLKSGTDYSVEYKDNTNAGTATVTVKGTGNYTGTVTKTFVISRAENIVVTLSKTSYTYSGNENKPGVTVTCDGKTLKSGADYSVEYEDNTNAGTATVTVKGTGNYTGTVTKTFVISKAENTITVNSSSALTAKTGKKQTLTLDVSTKSGAAVTYSDFKSSGSKKATYKNGKITFPKKFVGSVTIKATAAATGNYESASKTLTITVNPTKTTLSSVKNASGKKISVKWKKNSLATGYEIQYSTSKTFASSVKTVTVTKKATTTKKLSSGVKKGKTYYVRIRTYKKVGTKKYYSAWSTKMSVKIKK